MSDTISRQAAIDMVKGWKLNQHIMDEEDALDDVNALPSVQPKTQKLLDDGTLIVHTDIDIIKITRVNITQNNTHYGGLFYRDEE